MLSYNPSGKMCNAGDQNASCRQGVAYSFPYLQMLEIKISKAQTFLLHF